MRRTATAALAGLTLVSSVYAAGTPEAEEAIRAGRFAAAERAARASLAAIEGRPGVSTSEVADALDRVAEAIAGNWAVAEDSLRIAVRAVDLRRGLSGERSPRLAASLFHLARIAQRRGDLDRARESDEAALAILERSDPPDEPALMASAALLAGYLDWRFGEASRSKALIDRAMSIASRRGFRDPEAAIALRILGDIEQRAGNLRRAMELQRRCIEIQARLLPPSHGARGMCWNNLAIASWRLGDAAAARFAAEQARSVWEAAHGPDHPAVATALANLARPVLDLDGDADGAAALLRRAARIYESAYGPEHDLVASTLLVLGDLRAAVGEDAEALDAFERAAEIRERAVGPDHASRMDPYYLLGVTLEKLGDLDEAGRVYREIAAWSERSGSEGWGFAMRVRLAHVVELQGDLERACREYRAAASGDSSGHEPRQMQQLFTEALQGAARCAWRERRELAETVALLERALAIRERVFGTRSAEAAEVHDGLGLAYREGGDLDASRQALETALAIRERRQGSDHPDTARARLVLATTLAASGDARGAVRLALRAERDGRAHLRLLAAGVSEDLALRYARARPSGLDLAVSLAAAGRLDRSDTRLLLDELLRSRAVVHDVMAARAGSARASGERAAYLVATSRLAHAVIRGVGDGTEARHEALMRRLRGEQARAERALAAADPRFREFLEAEGAGFDDVREALSAGQTLVSIVRFDPGGPLGARYGAFVIRRDGDPAFVAIGDSGEVDRRVAAWRVEGSRRPTAGRDGMEAYRRVADPLRRAVWDPVARAVGRASEVFWVPDGALHAVAVGALTAEDGGFLVEVGPTVAPLAAERDLLMRGDPRRNGDLLVVGGVDFDGGGTPSTTRHAEDRDAAAVCRSALEGRLRALPGTAEEVERVASAWPVGKVVRLGGADATEEAFKRLAPGRSAIHLATHGLVLERVCEEAGEVAGRRGVGRLLSNDHRTFRSAALAFAGANRGEAGERRGDDGWLTMEEVAALDLSAAEWVVLSACDTAAGDTRELEGIVGLRRAFRTAGAGALVASLWAVDDRATTAWMDALYRARAVTRDASAAVRQASLAVLSARRAAGLDDHPFWWGGFVGGR